MLQSLSSDGGPSLDEAALGANEVAVPLDQIVFPGYFLSPCLPSSLLSFLLFFLPLFFPASLSPYLSPPSFIHFSLPSFKFLLCLLPSPTLPPGLPF